VLLLTIKQWCTFCQVEKIEQCSKLEYKILTVIMFRRYQLPIWHQVSGVLLHFPGRVYGLCLPQVGNMKRKLGPRPSQEVLRNPRQSRSERHSFAGGPKNRARVEEIQANTRIILKKTIFCFWCCGGGKLILKLG